MAASQETVVFPMRYKDPEYQKTHFNLFSESLTRPLEKVLPPGVTQADFDAAVASLKQAVGPEHVMTGESLVEYIDPYELFEDPFRRKIPSGAVCPKTLEETQSVLRIANEYKIPVWTFSRGKNLGYGGPAPRLSGSLALDLNRMDRILDVNEEFAYAVVEPGVTFTDLYDYCVLHKLRVWPSVPSLGWGSVVGNTLDRGTGFLPTATHHQHIAGLEVVLADGDVVRTGQFAISDSPSAHLSKFTFGPSIEGLFLQSNLGIVTKMGIWLTPQPQAYMSCGFDMPEFEDIEPMTDMFNTMRQNGVLPNTVYISNIVEWLGMTGKREEYWDKDEPLPAWKVRELQDKLGMGYWNAKFGLYGPKIVVQAQFEEFKRVAALKAPCGRLYGELFTGQDDQLLDATTVKEPHGGPFVGVPTLWSLPMINYRMPKDGKGIAGHVDYSPIMPSSGKAVLEWAKASRQVCEGQGWDLFCDFFMHERHVIFVNFLTFDKSKAEHRQAISTILSDLFTEGKKRGYSTYRTHLNYMDLNADSYDFNKHSYRRFVEKIKDAVDPNGILSPGKQGMWPEKYRCYRDNIERKEDIKTVVVEGIDARL